MSKKPLRIRAYAAITIVSATLAGFYSHLLWTKPLAAENSLLAGRVVSSGGQPLAGVPVRAHRDNSTISVSVYTNGLGDYSFPAWSDVSAGSYSIGIDLPDFTPVKRESFALSAAKTARLDFTLHARQPSIEDATAS